MIRIIRRLLGVACFVLAAWWTVQALLEERRRPRYGVDRDTGIPTGLRISPLREAERSAALALERELLERPWTIGT